MGHLTTFFVSRQLFLLILEVQFQYSSWCLAMGFVEACDEGH